MPNPRSRLKPEMFASIALGVRRLGAGADGSGIGRLHRRRPQLGVRVDEGRSLQRDDRSRSIRTKAPTGACWPVSDRATASSRTARCCCVKKNDRGPADGQANRLIRPVSAAVPAAPRRSCSSPEAVAAFRSLPVEAFPDVTDIQATVITLFPGHAPEEVEKQVTIPLEIALTGVPHSVRMFSHTQFGLSFLTLTFDDQVDDYFARQRCSSGCSRPICPPDIQPQLAPLVDAGRRALPLPPRLGDTSAPTELRSIEDWVVERAAQDGARRRRRRQPRRVHQAVSGEPRPRPDEGVRRHRCNRCSPRSDAATPTPAGTISNRASSST